MVIRCFLTSRQPFFHSEVYPINQSVSMIRLAATLLLLIVLEGRSQTQNDSLRSSIGDTIPLPKNVISAEFLGTSCSFLSLHYSRIIHTTQKSYYDVDVGAGYLPDPNMHFPSNYTFGVSLSATWNASLYKRHHTFGGLGLAYSDGMIQEGYDFEEKTSVKALYASLQIGYKYQKPKNSFFFKLYGCPLFQIREFSITRYYNGAPLFMAGMGLGYSFR